MIYYHCIKCGKKYKGKPGNTKTVKEYDRRGKLKEKSYPSCCGKALRVIEKKTYEAIK